MNISIIGAGNVGSALGKSLAKAGHTLFYGVPTPDDSKYADLKQNLGGSASFAKPEAAAQEYRISNSGRALGRSRKTQ